jgi:hypothetical protein
MHAIAVPLWLLATVAVLRFLRYAGSGCKHSGRVPLPGPVPPPPHLGPDDFLTESEREKERFRRRMRKVLPSDQIKGSYVPPSNTPPPPVPAPEWPLRRAQLLALAHKWRVQASAMNMAGDSYGCAVLDQCADDLEKEGQI